MSRPAAAEADDLSADAEKRDLIALIPAGKPLPEKYASSKDKEGILRRDVLTKQWTDWVHYWAVDFHYESGQEIIKVASSATRTISLEVPPKRRGRARSRRYVPDKPPAASTVRSPRYVMTMAASGIGV